MTAPATTWTTEQGRYEAKRDRAAALIGAADLRSLATSDDTRREESGR